MSPTPQQVLIVDNEPTYRRILEFNFRMNGYAVTGACDAAEALRLAEQTEFDLIVTDYHMPFLSGGELVRLLRKTRNYADTPVILISAGDVNSDMEDLDRDPSIVRLPKLSSIRKLIETAANCMAKPAAAT